jgi:hypothetical protein
MMNRGKRSKNGKRRLGPKCYAKAIRDSGESMYALAKGTGLGYAVVWRFVAGERTLSQDASDRLCQPSG